MAGYEHYQTQESDILKINVPGYSMNDITVDVKQYWVLQAMVKDHQGNGGTDHGKAFITEFASMVVGQMQVNEIQASLENGVLTIAKPTNKASSLNATTPPLLKHSIQTPENYIFKINLPEYRMEEIRVYVRQMSNILVKADKPARIIQVITFPNYNLKVDQIKTSMEEASVLTIVVPKDAPKPKPQIIPIKSKL